MKIVNAKCSKTIPLGRLGENDYTLIRFDVSGWLAEYPDAVIGLYNQRPGDNSAYPVADLTVNNGVAEWQITNVELTQTGQGKCQLVAIKDSVVIKSMIYGTIILDALDESGDVPDPWDSWEDRFIELKGEAEQAASDAESAKDQILGMRAQAITLAPGSEATANYDDGVLTLGIPQGEQGAPGQDGAPGAKGDKGDKGDTGATGAQGQKGEKGDKGDKGDTGDQGQKGDKGDPGDPTELIDDNAGAGVTDKVWSASKSAGEVSDLLSAVSAMNTATSADEGKALKAKTISGGKVTEWEFGDVGSPTDDELSTVSENPVQNKVITNALGSYSSLSDYGSNITEILAWLIDAVENPIDPNAVDICVFAGQSNMDGRGDASEAPTVAQGTAFKWDKTNQAVVDFTAEPSMIPAYVKTYYEKAKVPIVEVKEATGGINITQWMSTHGASVATQLPACKSYLENHGKTVRRVFMLWNQGENDVTDGTTTSEYETLFAQMKTSVMAAGVEKIFIVNIGQVSVGNYDLTPIRTALENVCDGTDVIMVSDKFYNATQYMKDQWHYTQLVYNVVGENAAENTVYFYKTGDEPNCIPFDASDVYGVPDDYMDLSTSGWTYNLAGIKAVLTACTAVSTEVKEFGKLGDMYYLMRLAYPAGGYSAVFAGNTVTKNVIIDDGVVFAAPTNGNDGNYGLNFANGATALESITGIPPMTSGCGKAFYGTSSLAQSIDITNMVGTWDQTFRNSGVTAITGTGTGITDAKNVFQGCTNLVSVCDLDGTYNSLNATFRDCSNLESVGILKSTAVTSINQVFYGCTKLSGIVKFMSSDIASAQYAFYNCDLTKIEIQVPANSTTYTTIITAYPDANVTTFTPD